MFGAGRWAAWGMMTPAALRWAPSIARRGPATWLARFLFSVPVTGGGRLVDWGGARRPAATAPTTRHWWPWGDTAPTPRSSSSPGVRKKKRGARALCLPTGARRGLTSTGPPPRSGIGGGRRTRLGTIENPHERSAHRAPFAPVSDEQKTTTM